MADLASVSPGQQQGQQVASLPASRALQRSIGFRPHAGLASKSQRQEAARIEKLCLALADRGEVPPWAKALLTQLGPLLSQLVALLDQILPYVQDACIAAYNFYLLLPGHVITMIYGIILCFFGGTFTATIAAAEAFRVSGGERVMACLQDLYMDFQAVRSANSIDNKKDDDGDGVADVDQIDKTALATRKIGLVLKSVNPDRIMTALGGLAQACAGVLATLKLQFARTVAIAVSISDNLRKPARLFLLPVLAAVMPLEYQHWISTILDLTCKLISLTVAWWLTRIIAACHSGMIGGMLAARAFVRFGTSRGLFKINEDETMLDEAAGWALAVGGVYFQLSNGMELPFPLSFLLFPIRLVEFFLQWVITFSN